MPAGWDSETLQHYTLLIIGVLDEERVQYPEVDQLHHNWSQIIYDEMTGLVWC